MYSITIKSSVNLTIKAKVSDTLYFLYWYYEKNRTSVKVIGYGLYLYFLGLSYRKTAKALFSLKKEIMLYTIPHSHMTPLFFEWF